MENNHEWNCWSSLERERGLSFLRNAWTQRCTGGYGVFQTYMPFTEYTSASFLQKAGNKVPVLVKFGSLEGNVVDTARDMKGMSVKFKTDQGEFDLLCSGYPAAAWQDCESFCDYIRAIRPDEASNLADNKKYWAYMASHDTAVHHMLMKYSDMGTRKNYGKMEWFSLLTYEWINREGKMHLVRWMLRPMAGVECINRQEAEFLAGFDPDIARRSLFDALSDHIPVEFELLVQVIPEERVRAAAFDPLNPTCRWCGSMAAELAVGKLTLLEPCVCHEMQLAEASFSVRQLVDGMRLANVPLARLIALLEPKRSLTAAEDVFSFEEYGKTGRNQQRYTLQQAAAFCESLSDEQKNHLRGNLIDELIFIDENIQKKIAEKLYQVSPTLAKEIEKGLTF